MASGEPTRPSSAPASDVGGIASAPRSQVPLVDTLQQALLLAQITNEIRHSLETNTIFATAVDQVQALMQADRVAIFQLDPASGYRQGTFVAEKVAPGFSSTLAAEVQDNYFAENYANRYRLGQIMVTSDIHAEGLSECHVQLLAQFQIRANLVVPLLQGTTLWGLLCIHQCSGPRDWQPSEVDFIQKLADQLSIALQQAALLEETQRRSQELQQALEQVKAQKEREALQARYERNLNQIVQHIRHSLDIEDIFTATTQDLRQALGCDRIAVYRFFPDWSGEFVFESVAPQWAPFSVADAHWADTCLQAAQGHPYCDGVTTAIDDIYQQSYSGCHLERLEHFQIRAFIIVPVFVGDHLWGLLAAYQHHQPRHWQTMELTLLTQVSGQLGVALQQANLLQQLRAAKRKADAANQAKGAFLASMSHELRTPLNAILGFSQLLTRDCNLTSEQKQTLNTINRSGAHLLGLVNDVLEMSKIEAGKVQLNCQDFDLYALLDALYSMLRLKAESCGLQLTFEREPHLPQWIHTDEGRLRQVLINLLGNALKFTKRGSVKLTVTQQAGLLEHDGQPPPKRGSHADDAGLGYAPQCYLHILVQDTGIGIPEQELTHVFDVFTQATSRQQSLGGTGLGLAICQQFVHLMQGNIQIESQVGQGTTVIVQIPVAIAAAQPQLTAAAPTIASLAPGQPPRRILIAEDHLDSQQLLMKLLQGIGFEVDAVSTGQAAIDRWQKWQPHLIFMDWHMPILGGAEATQTIRRLEASCIPQSTRDRSPQPPASTIILALTASVFENTQQATQQAGCDGFICKPFDETTLLQAIAKHLGVRYLYTTPTAPLASPSSIWTTHNWQTDLSHWSQSQLIQLQRAAIELDEDQVARLLDRHQTTYPNLTLKLRHLSQTLQFGKMADYAQAALQQQRRTGTPNPTRPTEDP